ncbi:hypothetical protein GGF32_001187 [Allomyces javanicus]|nr:hypothetical protein GGF32_001187 [Allomyces javanicus]
MSPTSPFLCTGDADDGVRAADVRLALGYPQGGRTPWDMALLETVGVRLHRFQGPDLGERQTKTDLKFVLGLRYRDMVV